MGLRPSEILQMPTGNDKFRAAADEASCVFLLNAGGAAAQVAAYSLLTGNLVVGGVAAAATGIAVYAYGKGCQWDPSGAEYPTEVTLSCCPPFDDTGDQDKWWKYRIFRLVDASWLTIPIGYSGSANGQYDRGWIEQPTIQGGSGTWNLRPCGPASFSTQGVLSADFFDPAQFRDLHIVSPVGTGCDPAPTPLPDPYVYTDPDDGCQIQVTMLGWGVDEAGNYTPVWQMDPVLPPATRTSGGIIGGCNFQPVIYYDGPGGPVLPPVPPSPTPGPGGEPWWLAPLLGALGGATAIAIDRALDELFTTPIPQWQYTMRAACNYKQDGTYEDYTITLPEAPYQERMLQLAETQLDFLQQHLLWKTPTCGGGGQSVSGDPVTINWISDEVSPVSGSRLNKIFTYFDQNNTTLADTVDHWRDFTWQAGPVIVSCAGTPLGKPQVWASSLDEAKRVIGHAATIAGVDLKDAEWLVGTARSDRNGVSAHMRVLVRQGLLGITKRDGPNGYPEALPA